MTTLTDFLLARIAEDEAAAKYAEATWTSVPSTQRVLAECNAKRQIIKTHLDNESQVASYRSPRWADAMNDDDRLNWRKAEARRAATERVVHTLAQVYADHPNYQPEWSTNG